MGSTLSDRQLALAREIATRIRGHRTDLPRAVRVKGMAKAARRLIDMGDPDETLAHGVVEGVRKEIMASGDHVAMMREIGELLDVATIEDEAELERDARSEARARGDILDGRPTDLGAVPAYDVMRLLAAIEAEIVGMAFEDERDAALHALVRSVYDARAASGMLGRPSTMLGIIERFSAVPAFRRAMLDLPPEIVQHNAMARRS